MTWEGAIIDSIVRLGGQNIKIKDIYRVMRDHPIVTPRHKEPWQPGLQPRYECWIRSSLALLKKKGVVEHVAPGTYSLKQ